MDSSSRDTVLNPPLKRKNSCDQFSSVKASKKMDPFSREAVLELLQRIIEWMKNREGERDTDNFNWTEFHLSVVHEYVSKLSLDSDCRVLSVFPDEVWYRMPGSSTIDASSVASFTQELKEFFVVPKQHQLYEKDDIVEQNELLAAFINFLLRLLHCRTGSVNSVKDRIDCLEMELRLLLTVVGDKSFICYEEQVQVQNLLAEIEAVVNVAGSLVHSIIFSTYADPIFKTMDERFGILRKHMYSFKANVIKFSNQRLVIAETNTNPKTAAEGSLFMVDSFLYDLEGLLYQEDNIMIADVKDQIKVLWQELKFSQSLIKGIKASQYSEAEELKEPIVQIKDAAYEAEYFTNSFLVGDAPFWYFSIRLSHFLHKIKLLRTWILEIKLNYDIGVSELAKNFSAQLSLQNKRSSKVDDIIVQNREKKLDSFSRYLVLRLFQLIIEWKKNKEGTRDTVNFNWTLFQLSLVHHYVSKLSLEISHFRLLSLVKLFKYEFCYFVEESSTIDANLVVSFVQEMKAFFFVPKQHQLFERDDVIEQNKLLAAFIYLLLRLLCPTTGSVNSAKDRVDCLEKELRFLLTVVGDKSLIDDEDEQVQNLLAEIEAVVNEAGSLVHSIVFSTFADPIFETMDDRLGVILKHMEFLKANITKFSNQQPVIAETNTNPKIAGDGSLFIVDSLLYDLQGLLNQEDNITITDVKDQIKVVWKELKFLHSLIKDIKASRYSEAEELKEPLMRSRDAAYEAEYLINSFLVGDAPFWYFSIRISHVLNKIKHLRTGIQEITKNYDIGASKLAKNFSAQLSLQNKRSSNVDDIIVQNIGKKLDSSSRDIVLRLFQRIIEWKRNREGKRDTVNFNWTSFHLSLVHEYVSKLSLHSGLAVRRLVKLSEDEFCYFVKASSRIDANSVVSFVQELKAFFVVPKQHQLFERDDVGEQNELLVAFINLLLRLLCHRTGSVNSAKDRVDCLEKELRFLLTVVGDIMLIRDEHELVQSLSAEIEAVVSEAGSLVHSIIFSTFADPIFKTIDEHLGILLEHMDSFKANVMKLSNEQPVIAETNTNPKIAGDGSFFIVDSLFYDLEGLLNQQDNMIADVKDRIKEVWQELKFSQSLIKDIKASQYSEAEELKGLVMRIRDAAYEAEYLINYFLVGDAPFWYFSTRLSHVLNKIKLLRTGIQEIKKNYDIGASKLAKSFSAQLSSENKRSSKVDDIIVGFEARATYIREQLEGENKHLQIICIFGMPGLGKTTLAKKLYNHPIVEYKFDKCSWCVVSQTYHKKNLLSDILVSLKSELDQDKIQKMEEEGLVEHIYKSLKGRRYLIVMDDIWSSNAWYDLQRCFPDDGNGSRILFTSRNKDVAPPQSIIYELPRMSDEQCWELLEKKMFQNECCPPQLLGTGKEIARKCRGLPLAAVVIGGILSSMDKERSAWKNVEGNLASYIFSDQSNSMMQILELSYKHLPDHLKPCFLYFGTFPEDKKISVRELKWLWAAEGFVHKEEEKNAESVAEEYLMQLIDKSLIIADERRSSDGGVKSCLVHDSLRDLCLKRCKEENFVNLVDKNYIIYEKHHRLLVRDAEDTIPFGLHIRSLIGSLPSLGVSNMKLLRVLDLLGIESYNDYIYDSIKHLVNLRYLAIYYDDDESSMGTLAWIESLVNLEFLVVVARYNDLEAVIPSAIVKMMKLRYVNFIHFDSVGFEEDWDSFRTNNLEFLGYVSIKILKDEEILKCSPHLRKLKCKCAALRVEETGTFRYLDFGFFTQLESLNVSFYRPRMEDMYVAPPNLPLNLKKLTLSRLGLPWEKMSIIGGLPNLQVLKLGYGACVGEKWETSDDEFQQLTFLKLEGLDLVQWNVPCSQHFPKLRHLVLIGCKNLQEIPSEVGEIVTLQLIKVNGRCQESLLESAGQIEREQRDNGNEELKVCLENSYWYDHLGKSKWITNDDNIESE